MAQTDTQLVKTPNFEWCTLYNNFNKLPSRAYSNWHKPITGTQSLH